MVVDRGGGFRGPGLFLGPFLGLFPGPFPGPFLESFLGGPTLLFGLPSGSQVVLIDTLGRSVAIPKA